MTSIRNSHAYTCSVLHVCQLVVVVDDGQQMERVANTRTVTSLFVFLIPTFLISLEHLSTGSYAVFPKFLTL